MPGKTPQLALDNYLHPLRQSLACVTDCGFRYTSSTPNDTHILTLAKPVAKLSCREGDVLGLSFVQDFKIQKSGTGYKVVTLSYLYGVQDRENNEIVQYHWHPSTALAQPHLHVPCAAHTRPEMHKAHLPTGRIAFEDFLFFLIKDFKVNAKDGYRDILETNREKFRKHCSWYWEST